MHILIFLSLSKKTIEAENDNFGAVWRNQVFRKVPTAIAIWETNSPKFVSQTLLENDNLLAPTGALIVIM